MLAGALYDSVPRNSASAAADRAQCSMPDAARLLAPYGGAVVLADMNLGPELLYRTQVKIVGALYIRGMAGAMRLRAALRARDLDTVPPELRATGAHYLLACNGAPRSPFVDGPETTLFDRLNHGEPPGWLRSVAGDPTSGWALYEEVMGARPEEI
jgi:hypothetical protein